MMEQAKCPKDKYKFLCSSIDKLDKEPCEAIKDKLISKKGLMKKMYEELYKYV